MFQDDNTVFIITEFANGGEIFSHLRKKERFDIPTAKFLAVEVACALQSVHDFAVVYRGIKPENIVLGEYGAFLHDFVEYIVGF